MKRKFRLKDIKGAKAILIVHEQQKERGATAVFPGSDGAEFGAKLAA